VLAGHSRSDVIAAVAPVANKLPLGEMRDISFEKLAIKAVPLRKESKLIAEWIEARKVCFNLGLEYANKNYPPQIVALAIEANNQETAVVAIRFHELAGNSNNLN
jgi:hypothetical protein